MSIIDISVKRPLLVIVFFIILTMLGTISYFGLNINLTPKIDVPILNIITVYPGASASVVETSLTKKIENAVSSLENLKKITSKSQENVSIVTIELQSGANTDLILQDAQRKINAIKSDLPKDIDDPSINKFSLDDLPIMKIVASSSMKESEFYRLIDEKIKNKISKLAGVGQITLTGGTKREIQINLDPNKLKSYNLSVSGVLQAIQMSNLDFPAGKVETNEGTYSIRLSAKFNSITQITSTKIASSPNGGSISIGDIAEVRDGIAEQTTVNRYNGINAIGLQIVKQRDANTVVVCDLIKSELKAIESEYANSNVKFTIATDASVYTKASVNAVLEDLVLAIIIVSIVCFIFLHSFRNAIIVMIAVPLSMIPAFIIMYIMGYSLNIMSLMALSLVVGILVDDSIVVIENMTRYIENGKNKVEAALLGSKQILFTATAITLVIVIVFLPLAIAGGLIGNLLHEFAIPIIVSTLTSLVVSFSLTPMLVSRFGRHEDISGKSMLNFISRKFESGFNNIKNLYVHILKKSFNHKTLLFTLIILCFVGVIALFPGGFIGTSFMSQIDQGEFVITLEFDTKTPVYKNNLQTENIEKMILKHKEVLGVFSSVGTSSSLGGNSTKNNVSQLTVKICEKKDRKIGVEKFAQQIKRELSEIPGIKVSAEVASLVGSMDAPIQVILKGDDFSKLHDAATTIKQIIKNIPGTSDVKFSIDDPKQEVNIDLDRKKMDELGISVYSVGSTLRTFMAGNTDNKYTDNGYDYDINIIIDKFNKRNSEDVASLTVMNNSGIPIEIKQFADVYSKIGPGSLERYNRMNSIIVKSNVVGRPTGTVTDEVKQAIKGKIPQNIEVTFGGMGEQQGEAFGTLFSSLGIAIILVYLIMVALYDSVVYPFVVLFSIPLAVIGAFLALALTLSELNVFSIIGLLTLIGLVAKNAILLVDFTNQLKAEGKPVLEALLEAGAERLRPIIMTTIAMIFGMFPVAIASGAGAEMKNGMAWVIIGGLTSSLVLTLFVVPNVYLVIEKIKDKFNKKKTLQGNATIL
jgi:hydrophobic/amphiphilic exporter-1 (mainly G- bacteria), HAE1 family